MVYSAKPQLLGRTLVCKFDNPLPIEELTIIVDKGLVFYDK